MTNPKPNRVIFLDVDGPLINEPMYDLHHTASVERTWFNTQALAYVKRLHKHTGALVVMNSTHNNHDVERIEGGLVYTLKDDLLDWGFTEDMFHKEWKTDFPNPKGQRFSDSSSNRRMLAIRNWLDQFDENTEWVAFDDEPFTEDRRLVVIDFQLGIDYTAYRKAMKLFGYRQEPKVIIL